MISCYAPATSFFHILTALAIISFLLQNYIQGEFITVDNDPGGVYHS